MTERKTSTIDTCMEALNAVIADLQRQGVNNTVLMNCLAEAAIHAAKAKQDHAQVHLDALAAITKAAADARWVGRDVLP